MFNMIMFTVAGAEDAGIPVENTFFCILATGNFIG